MGIWRQGNLRRVWDTAYQEVLEAGPDLDEQVDYWEENRPINHDLLGFYETYVWAVYFSGMKVATIEAKSDEITAALREFDVHAIAAEPEAVRKDLLTIIGHQQKADSVIKTAALLAQKPDTWDEIRQMPLETVLEQLRSFPYIGPQNRYHIVRNLGWDAPMLSGFTESLAAHLGTDCDALMTALSGVARKRVNTTDTVMGMWSRLHETEEDCIWRVRALLGLDETSGE